MITREPNCIQWKRQGAEAVAAQILNLNLEKELKFWQEKTQRLKAMQEKARKMKVKLQRENYLPECQAPSTQNSILKQAGLTK